MKFLNLTGLIIILCFFCANINYAKVHPQTANLSALKTNRLQTWNCRSGLLVIKFSPEFQQKTGGNPGDRLASANTSLAKVLAEFRISKIEKIFPNSKPPKYPYRVDLSRIYRLHFAAAQNPLILAKKLANFSEIEYAEPVPVRTLAFTPNDSLFSKQWHLDRIRATTAWNVAQGDSSVIIGIIDTGIDTHHPDIVPNLWHNWDEIPDNNIDDDQNGYVDDFVGWDFGENDKTPSNTSTNWAPSHGTHVAGIASAATNNRIGVAGIGFNCQLMAVKVTRDYQFDSAQYPDWGFEGIKYAVDNGAKIINCSWSGTGSSGYELDIIQYAHERDAVVIAAAGNNNGESMEFPGAYPHVFSIAATTPTDQRSTSSNFHYSVDLCAPGTDILSTWSWSPPTYTYGKIGGTSMAAPLVAGTVALVQALHPEWTAEQAAHQVRVTADDIYYVNPGFINKLGKGRLNAYNAVSRVSPAIRLEDLILSDTNFGDADTRPEPGEKIEVFTTFKNHLSDASNVEIRLMTDDPYVKIVIGRNIYSDFPENTAFENNDNPFVFEILPETPLGHEVEFTFEITADGDYSDREVFSRTIAPLYGTHAVGNVAFTITSFGAFGYYDYVNTEQNVGDGFQYPKGSVSTLFHGSLLVGVNATQVSDCAYGNAQSSVYDWQMTESGTLVFSSVNADQESYAQYNDAPALNPIGLTVNQRCLSWRSAPYDDFVILEFEIENYSDSSYANLYTGLYLDWDVDDYEANFVNYNAENSLGYQYAANSKYFGQSLVSPKQAASFRAIKNETYIYNTYTDKTKWQFMTEGFKLVESDDASDWSQLLTAGPIALGAGEKTKVVFAVLGGEDETDLVKNAQAAREKYQQVASVPRQEDQSNLPRNFQLSANFPNPFNQSTAIRYELPDPANVTIKIYNLQGQYITTLVSQKHSAGVFETKWDGTDYYQKNVPTGVYLIQMQTAVFRQTRKVLLIR